MSGQLDPGAAKQVIVEPLHTEQCVSELERRVAEASSDLELERGRNLLLSSELAAEQRRSAELESRLAAALSGVTPRNARLTPRPPGWSPAGSPRRQRPISPLSGTRTLRPSSVNGFSPLCVQSSSSSARL